MRTAIVLTFLFAVTSAIGQTNWKVNRSAGGPDLVTVYFTSSEKGWIAGDNGYLASTVDGGKTWMKKEIGSDDTINEVYFRNDENGSLVAGRRMLITRDGGISWQETQINRPNEFRGLTPEYLSIKFADKRRGIVVGSLLNKQERVVDSLVMLTENGGETWKRVIVPSKKELFHLDFVGSNRCWVVGDDGLILFSEDGGARFTAQKSGTVLDLYNVDFRDENEGYAVGSRGTILRTDSGGAVWETVRTSLQTTFMRVDFADDKNGMIVGYDGTILRSTDKGRTWNKQVSRTSDHLYGLFFVKKYGWAVGAKGTVIQYDR